jgi:pyruvate/2-oxoglutarate dehydrogenase complex dihydrolipoamide acyltransferase (E2) component
MPRTAAAILGLTFVAFSIGFNTVQYPVVWEMVGPVPANESAQAAVVSPSEEPESLAPAVPPQPAPEPEARMPLVPVTPAISPTASEKGTELAAGVRRLPPVDRARSDRANRGAAATFNGSIPVYPTTGL